jgi:DNA-directed RNA polymerase omega subunit
MDRIPEKIDSRFRYVLLAAERAEQLIRGGSPKIETTRTKPTRIAMDEISTDLVAWDYGPAPAVEEGEAEIEEAPAEA